MTENELKRMGRRDLIEIIFAQKKMELELRDLLEKADQKLADRNIRIDNAGSIAEASLTLNKVFEAAQAAADTYMQSIRLANADMEERLSKAEEERTRILEDAQREAQEKLAEADVQIAEKWDIFNENVRKVLESHAELAVYLQK